MKKWQVTYTANRGLTYEQTMVTAPTYTMALVEAWRLGDITEVIEVNEDARGAPLIDDRLITDIAELKKKYIQSEDK